MSVANSILLSTFFIIAVGYTVKKLNFITEQDGKTLSKILMHTTFPALMFVSTLRLKIDPNLYFAPIAALIFGVISISVGWMIFRKMENPMRGLLIMATGGFNMGLFAFPIIEGIWGKEGLAFAIIFDLGNTIVVFGMVYTIGNYLSKKHNQGSILDIKLSLTILKKIISSMPFLFMLLGLLFNFSGVTLPSFIMTGLDTLAQANKAIGILLLGIYLNFIFEKDQKWAISKVMAIRYTSGLLVVACIYIFLPVSTFQSVLMCCMIMPIGLTILPFSDELGYESRLAAALANTSLIISFILLSLFLSILQ